MSQNSLENRKYIAWDAPGVERVPENEAQDIQAVADMINQMQKKLYNQHRHMYGGTHCKTQGVVKGELIVENLPTHLAQSLFSKPAKYPVALRYSTEIGDPAKDDRIPQPRGLAMKVFNVQGEMFDVGKDYPTQDIEFNSTPIIELADAKTTREIFELRTKYGGDQGELNKHLQARGDADLQLARDKVPNLHLESTRQYSQSAYRFGDFVMKYSLVPSSETQKILGEETVDPDSHPDHILSDWLQAFHANHQAEYEFQVQLLENLEEQPVEYSGTPWNEDKYPWQTVAKIYIPKQDSAIPVRKAFWEDHIRLDPWHGLKSLQPLGSSNRLRRIVYPQSAALRRQTNGRREINLTNIDEIPDDGYIEVH